MRTPKKVIEAYNYELWNKQNYELGEEIIADQVVRHYPGSVETMSKEEAIQRVRDTYANHWPEIEFTLHKMTVEGELVTLLWEMQARTEQGEEFTYSSIEVFRVVDGKICEFWNPVHNNEANGLWG
ncbi:MAG: nuclear transport factor 2 family protein [Halieaceae bacterium]|nr:nuclear transport factor 2 family protein [Halieaceae bacterium]